jgi:hypothetical protein
MPNRAKRLAPAPSADNGKLDGFVIASTISKMQRDARAKAARASYEFRNTGDDALLKRAFAKNFADRTMWPPCAPTTIDLRPNRRLAPEKESI